MDMTEQVARELKHTVARLRGARVMSDGSAEMEGTSDEADLGQRSVEREIDSATRSLLIVRANRLADALTRIRRGVYGICEECGEPIEAARLRAAPEATACVRCQDRRERAERGRLPHDFHPSRALDA